MSLVASCQTAPRAVDSYCQVYGRVILNRADASIVKQVPDPVRKRVEFNDAVYRCTCEDWKNQICETLK